MTSSSRNSDPYLWVGSSSGSWNDGANWQDQTTDMTGSVPRGTNAITFGVDTPQLVALANDVVTGTGRSASLGLYGSLTLSGMFETGALDLYLAYDPPDSYISASLTVSGTGNSLQAKSVDAAGNLDVSNGAAMSVARTYEIASGFPTPNPARYEFDGISVDGAGSVLRIGGLLSTDNSSHISVTNGGDLEARRMTLTNANGIASYSVDAQSTIEVGTMGDAAAGTWTVDYGRVLTIDNVALSAPEFVDNGTIVDDGGLGLQGSPGNVTGSGKILIEANSLLTVGQAGQQLKVAFKGDNADLWLTSGAAPFSATIRGFATGNSITVQDQTFDSATWKHGMLDLFEGTTLVGALNMAGHYKCDTFSVANNVITLTAASGDGTAGADSKNADTTPGFSAHDDTTQRSLHMFMQAMASHEPQGSALHQFSATETLHANHPLLAAAR